MTQHVTDRNLHRVVGVCNVYRRSAAGALEYLILKRREDLFVYPGLWTIPGGGMDRDDYEKVPKSSPDGWEDPVGIAVRREIREETGVEVGPLLYLNNFSFIRPDDVPVFGMRFAAPYLSGEVKIDPKDSTEFAWIPATAAVNYNFLGKIAEEIRILDALLKAS